MRLTVLMVAYNAALHIAAALDSVLRQSLAAELDIVVVDDGSTDATPQILAALAARHRQIRILRTPNSGISAARNRALQAIPAATTHVSFLDADDLIPAGRYARDLAHFTADPALDLTYGEITYFRQANATETAPQAGSETARLRSIQLAAGIYRADFLRQIGRFDETLPQAEDTDFLLRLFEAGPRYHLHSDNCLYYRRHGGNITRDRATVNQAFRRALMLSIKRRQGKALAPYPAGLFDAKNLGSAYLW